MTWTITDGVTTHTCFGNSVIRYKLQEMDAAEVRCRGYFTEDTKVTISEGATVIFRGYVKNIEQDANERTYSMTIIETAVELKDTIVEYSGSRSFIRSSQTVQSLIDTIITGTGWTRGTTDSTVVTSLGFYQTTAASAIFKLLKDMQGKNIWFIDNGTTKTIYWGTTRTDRTATAITYLAKTLEKDSNDRNITKVTVLGQTDTAIYTTGTGTKERVFRYKPAKTTAECTDIAIKLLADYGVARNRYKVKIPPNYVYEIGDLVKVDGTNYTIRDIETTQSYTMLGIGSYDISYADTLGADLTVVSGEVVTGTDASWSGGNTNVAANAAAYTTYIWDIKDINQISNAYIDATIGAFIKSASVATETELLSDVSQIVSSSSYTDTTWLVGTNYFPSSSGFSVTNTDGHQLAMATFIGDFYASSSYGATRIEIQCQYSTNGSTWTTLSPFYRATINTTVPTPASLSCLVPGTTSTTLYVRFMVTPQTDYAVRVYYGTYQFLQSITRHKHSVTTTYDKTTTGTAPSTISVHINSGTDVTLTPGTPIALSGTIGTLITGKNTIYVKTPSGAGNQCSVNPTITYQTLGKS